MKRSSKKKTESAPYVDIHPPSYVELDNENSCFITKIYLQPGASKTQIRGVFDGRLKLAIQAPPVEGAANEAVLEWFCEQFELPKSKVHLVTGEKSRNKSVLVQALFQPNNKVRNWPVK